MPAAGGGKNREALLEAAIACLQKHGYARSTSRELAAAAGANLAAITYHYGSKEQLLNEALAEGFRRWAAALASEQLGADGETPPVLERAAERVEASFERNRGLAQAFLEALAQADRSPALRRDLARAYEELRSTLAAQLAPAAAGEEDSARALASGLLAIFDGLLIQWLLDRRRTPRASEILEASRRLSDPHPRAPEPV